TAIVVTILQLRQTFHTAMLSQTVTPDNIPLQQLMSNAQQWGVAQGLTAVQSQTLALSMVFRQVATTAAVMAFDDVFRVTAAVTLLAIVPALFLNSKKTAGRRPGPVLAD